MRIKILFIYFFLMIYQSIGAPSMPSSLLHADALPPSYDHYIHALASLVFHTQEWEKRLIFEETSEEDICFSSEDTANLWNKVRQQLLSTSSNNKHIQRLAIFEKAYQEYEQAHNDAELRCFKEAQEALHSSSEALSHLWQEAIAYEEIFSLNSLTSQFLRKKSDSHFNNNPYISSKIQEAMRPYLLPMKHTMHSVLDSIFTRTRATQDKSTFYKAGFRTIANGPRSFICVAKHPKIPGYLVKVYLDTELKEKFHKASWEWLVRRCEGASKVRNIIKTREIRYFVVADKWIYCLPPEPSPPNDNVHTRHLALLLVTNMNLVPEKRNYDAWYYYITKEHLQELFEIISRAKGSSYRPDNIAYTKYGTFAFIDTEYPSKGPDFKSIRRYLHPKMCEYWDQLVRNGGDSSSRFK